MTLGYTKTEFLGTLRYVSYIRIKIIDSTNATGSNEVKKIKRYVKAVPVFNLLNPTGHVMHQQFNIQEL